MVSAENGAASPWEPLHQQFGLEPNQNALTVSFPNGYVQIVPRTSDCQGMLDTIVARPGPRWRQVTLMVCPSHATTLAESGMSKHAVIEYMETANPDDPANTDVTSISGPESVRVVVAGGPGAWIGLILGAGRWVSRPIMLPANRDRLINKYGDYVPNYLRY